MIGQWTGGFLHHRYFVRNQRPWHEGRVIKAHKLFLGPAILSVGLVNAALGFALAVAGAWNKWYVPLVFVMLIALSSSIFLKGFLQKRRSKQTPNPEAFEPMNPGTGRYGAGRRAGYGEDDGQELNQYGGEGRTYDPSRSDIALSTFGEPPAYGQPETQSRTVL